MAGQELDISRLFSLKVDELKEELRKRNLPQKGTKSQLQERLLQYVETSTNESVDIPSEQLLLADTTDSTKKDMDDTLNDLETPTLLEDQNKFDEGFESSHGKDNDDSTNAKPVLEVTHFAEERKEKIVEEATLKPTALVKLSNEQRIENRSKRFGSAVSESEKKKARLLKFGGNSNTKVLSSNNSSKSEEILKKREERFGKVTKPLNQLPESEKLKLRKERFVDNRIKKRQERFGVISS